MYQLVHKNATNNINDSATNYIRQGLLGTSNQARIYVPKTGLIKKIRFTAVVTGTLASSETSTIYLNKDGATSETLLSSSIKFDATTQTYLISNANVSVTKGQYINIQLVSPVLATNPTNVNILIQVTVI